MQKWVLVLAATVAAVGLVCVAPVRADDESDRKSYISDINSLLRDTSDYLRSARDSTTKSEVESARDRVAKVRDKLSSLDRVNGNGARPRRRPLRTIPIQRRSARRYALAAERAELTRALAAAPPCPPVNGALDVREA
jgi:hypothetical protein